MGAVVGVLNGVLQMIEEGAAYLGVATDHVIESFRNELWSEYKTGDGIEPALRAQFQPLEDALTALGVVLWPMVELEADDALASAAASAAKNRDVQKVCIWTPDKDLAQCVRGDHIVQVDRKSHVIRNAEAVRAKFGVIPQRIPDSLGLVGDAADGYPGIAGIGSKGAAGLIDRFGPIEDFPPEILGERKPLALLFKKLATLRDDAAYFWMSARCSGRVLVRICGDRREARRSALARAGREGIALAQGVGIGLGNFDCAKEKILQSRQAAAETILKGAD